MTLAVELIADPELREALDGVAKDWAELPVDAEGLDEAVLLARLRQAYGAGYLAGLRERQETT